MRVIEKLTNNIMLIALLAGLLLAPIGTLAVSRPADTSRVLAAKSERPAKTMIKKDSTFENKKIKYKTRYIKPYKPQSILLDK